MHIAKRLQIVLLTLVESLLQHRHLNVQGVDITTQHADVVTNGVNGAAFVGNLGIDNLQVLKPLLHILAVGLQLALLLLNLLLQLLTLILKTLHRGLGLGRLLRLLGLISPICLISLISLISPIGLISLLGGRRLPLRRLLSLCRSNSNGQQPTTDGQQPEQFLHAELQGHETLQDIVDRHLAIFV